MEFLKKLIDMYITIYARARAQHAATFRLPSHLCTIFQNALSDKFTVFWEKLTKALNPSWVPITQICGCLPVGADRGPAGN